MGSDQIHKGAVKSCMMGMACLVISAGMRAIDNPTCSKDHTAASPAQLWSSTDHGRLAVVKSHFTYRLREAGNTALPPFATQE